MKHCAFPCFNARQYPFDRSTFTVMKNITFRDNEVDGLSDRLLESSNRSLPTVIRLMYFNMGITLKKQLTHWCQENFRHFADDISNCMFLNENVWIVLKISLKLVTKFRFDNIPTSFAWSVTKPLSGPMVVSLLTHICVTRPWRVNPFIHSCRGT